jgi:hypothetical protein
MALSEDARAIVASNLAAAHITAAKGLGAVDATKTFEGGVSAVTDIFRFYLGWLDENATSNRADSAPE